MKTWFARFLEIKRGSFGVRSGNSNAQGTLEYLVIIGVVIVISLVVVGLVLTHLSSGENISGGSSKLSYLSRDIALV